MLGVRPVAHRHDEIALDPNGARRRRAWNLPALDAVGPVGERRQMAAVGCHHAGNSADHIAAGRAGLQAARPCGKRRIEVAQRLRNITRGIIADLVAIAATVGFDRIEPQVLALEGDRNAVAVGAGAGELAPVRHPDHRGPIDRRIILCRRRKVRGDDGGEVEGLAGLGRNLRRVDEAVAPHPHPICRLRQVGHHEASEIIGHRHLGEPCAEVRRFRHHPDAGFRSHAAGHDAADIIGVDCRRGHGGGLLRPRRVRRAGRQRRKADRRSG